MQLCNTASQPVTAGLKVTGRLPVQIQSQAHTESVTLSSCVKVTILSSQLSQQKCSLTGLQKNTAELGTTLQIFAHKHAHLQQEHEYEFHLLLIIATL